MPFIQSLRTVSSCITAVHYPNWEAGPGWTTGFHCLHMHIFISATDHLTTALLDHHQIKMLNCTVTISLHSHIFYSIPACQLLISSPSLQLYFNNFYIYTHSMYPPPVHGFHLVLLPCSPFKALDTRLNGVFYLSVE